MSDFLVRTTVELPDDLGEDERAALVAAEHAAARELVAAGLLLHLWRLPGAPANVGVWRVKDATELHAVLSGLPMARYLGFEVTALADHPVMAVPAGADAAHQDLTEA